MKEKTKKVYAVVARYEENEPPERQSFFAALFSWPLNKKHGSEVLAVFSTKAKAAKWMADDNNLCFDFHPHDCHIQEWKIDYWT